MRRILMSVSTVLILSVSAFSYQVESIGVENFHYSDPVTDLMMSSNKVSETNERDRKTIYYYGHSRFYVSKTGKRHTYRLVDFISVIKQANCDNRHRYSFRNEIAYGLKKHVLGYYKSSLGVRPSHGETVGYWAYDTPRVLSRSRANTARVSQYTVSVPDFVYYCR